MYVEPLLADDDGRPDNVKLVPHTAIWMVCLIVFIDSLGGSISAPVMPFYAKEFQASSRVIGLLFSSFSLSQVVALPMLGKLSDRIGRRPVLVISLFGAAGGALVQGLAPNVQLLFVGRVISGFCGAIGSTANVYISDVTDEESRPEYLGYLMSSNGLAFAFGPGLGGGLSTFGMNVPILVNAGLCIAAGFLAAAYLPESPIWVAQQKACARRQCMSSSQNDLNDQQDAGIRSFSLHVWGVCMAEFLRGLSFSSIFSIFALFAHQVYGLGSVSIGFAVCAGALCLICTNIWLSPRLDMMLGHVGCAGFGMALIAVGELGLAYSPTLYLSLFGMCIVYMGQAVAGCTIATITSVLATDTNRGAVMSMQQMAQALGRVVGPVILSSLFSEEPEWPYACASVASIVGMFVLSSLRTTFRTRAESHFEAETLPTPPVWSDEVFTDEDVEEMGRFLCELLTKRHYRWRGQGQRAALKKALELHFPMLSSDPDDFEDLPEKQDVGHLNSQADPTAACAVGDLIARHTPMQTATRRHFGSKQRAGSKHPAR